MSTNPPDKTGLDKAIDDVLNELDNNMPGSQEHASATDQLIKLHKLKMDEASADIDRIAKIHEMSVEDRPKRVTPDTLVLAGANLLGIIMIVGYESRHIVTSKAIGFIGKLR